MNLKKINLFLGDCKVVMKSFPDNSIDLLLCDPPYGYSFMGKDWDKVLPPKEIWKECYRVLKPGSFAFVMSAPRQDVMSRMMIRLEEVGFKINFSSIYYTYATGFPKAGNIGKMVDKRLGVKPKSIGKIKVPDQRSGGRNSQDTIERGGVPTRIVENTIATSPQAKELNGSYSGFQPKPAVEIIIVAMKPLSEKTYVDQALKNGKGISWLDNCRIPYESEKDKWNPTKQCNISSKGLKGGAWANEEFKSKRTKETQIPDNKGRFPANLLVSDDSLNDGKIRKSGKGVEGTGGKGKGYVYCEQLGKKKMGRCIGDSGSYSRYFSLDAWWKERVKKLPLEVQKVFPYLIVPKSSKSQKNKGLENLFILKKDTSEEIIKELEGILNGK